MITGPNIIKDGLVVALDASNIKSFRGEPTTNLLPLPTNFGNGRDLNSGATFTDFNTGGFNGNQFVRITRTSTPTNEWDFSFYNSSPNNPDGTLFTFSFYARSVDNSTTNIKVSNPDAEAQFFNLTADWQRFEVTFTLGVQTPGILWIRINRSNQESTIGSNYDLCMGQIEFKNYATPFVDGTRGTTVATGGGWKDLSGNGNNNDIFNGVTYSNNCLVFDGSNDYTQATNISLTSISNITISYWFKLNTWASSWSPFIDISNSGGVSILRTWVGTDRNIDIELGSNSIKPLYGLSSVDFPNNSFVYVTVCLSHPNISNNVKCYVNGVYKSQGTCLIGGDTPITLRVGRGGAAYGSGKLGFVDIYNRVLTPQEIQQNYNASKLKYNL